MAEFSIVIDGRTVEGWQQIRVSRSLDEIADSWEVGVVARATGSGAGETLLFEEGQTAVIKIDGAEVVTGYVDVVRRRKDAASRAITLSGRSKAGDLVDCSILGKHAWRDVSAIEIANDLTSYFGIVCSTKIAGLENVQRFRAKAGEEVFTALDKLARDAGARWQSRPTGDLELVRAGATRAEAALVAGVNIFESELTLDGSQRFSDYIFRSQMATSDNVFGDDAANVEVAVVDPGASRNRPLIVHDDHKGIDGLKRRAEWERNTRAGRAVVLRITTISHEAPARSWYAGTRLWTPGELVTVIDDAEGTSGEWLCAAVDLTYSDQGTRAALDLVGPKAYDPEPVPKKRKKGGTSW